MINPHNKGRQGSHDFKTKKDSFLGVPQVKYYILYQNKYFIKNIFLLSSTETAEELKVNLKDCEKLLRNKVVGLPGEFSWFLFLSSDLTLSLSATIEVVQQISLNKVER